MTPAPLPEIHLSSNARMVMHFVTGWRDGDIFDLDAPYQRESVWTDEQRRNLIKSLLMGLPIGSVIVSALPFDKDRPKVCYRVVDGKQRIEAMRAFVDGDLTVPAAWFRPFDIENAVGDDVTFAQLARTGRGRILNAMVGELELNAAIESRENPRYDPASMDKWHKVVEGADPKTVDRYIRRARTPEEILQAEAELYLLVNFGGVPQTDDDRARAQEVADR